MYFVCASKRRRGSHCHMVLIAKWIWWWDGARTPSGTVLLYGGNYA